MVPDLRFIAQQNRSLYVNDHRPLDAGHCRSRIFFMEELHGDGNSHLSTFPVQRVPVD